MATSTRALDDVMADFADRADRPPAFGVAVIDGFHVSWSSAEAATRHPLFEAGSISKLVAALVALELVARGELDLNRDVNEYLRSWQLPGPSPVSLRQLLGHTAGIGVPFYPGYPQGDPVPSLSQVLDGIPPAATPPVRVGAAPAGRFCYSGGAYAVVQQVIADVTGTPFAQAADALVLEPYGMRHSTFEQPLPDSLRPLAARADWRVYPEQAAAGLWTTPDDLARCVCTLQAAFAGRPSPCRPETARLVMTKHARLPEDGEWAVLPSLGVSPPDACGLGLFLQGDGRLLHLGGAASFFSVLTGTTRDGTGAVVMTASNASEFLFELLLALDHEQSWTGFRSATSDN